MLTVLLIWGCLYSLDKWQYGWNVEVFRTDSVDNTVDSTVVSTVDMWMSLRLMLLIWRCLDSTHTVDKWMSC